MTGAAIPDALTVQVHEESATSFHLVLPPDSQLSEEEMAQVFGGDDDWASQNQPETAPDNTTTSD